MPTSSPSKFAPDYLPFETTLARQIVRQHLNHLNTVFWLGQSSTHVVNSSYTAVVANNPGVKGHFKNATLWQSATQDFDTWSRQNAVISAASMLEVYIVSAGLTVFQAMPELLDRSLLGTDSVHLLKNPDTLSTSFRKTMKDRAESFTKGRWTDRLQRLRMAFGKIPATVEAEVSHLQQLQDLRNKIAHKFGHDGETLRRTPWEPVKAIKPTDAKIISYFRVVDVVTAELDKHVFGPLTGGYEIVSEYDMWRRKTGSKSSSINTLTEPNDFKNYIGQVFGRSPSKEYIRSMIQYYQNA